MLKLYLMAGTPAAEQFLIIVCTPSISRSRSGLFPSMMPGFFSRSMWLDARFGGVSRYTVTPFRSATSRICFSSSTVAYSLPGSSIGGALTTCLMP